MSATPAPAKSNPKSKKADSEPPTTQSSQPEETVAEPLETQPLQSENVSAESSESQPLQSKKADAELPTTQSSQPAKTSVEPSKNTSDAEPSESKQSDSKAPKKRAKKADSGQPKTKLGTLLEERKELDKLIKEEQEAVAQEKRKQETRKKILIGAAMQKQISKGKLTEAWLLEVLDAELTLDYDRKVFNLLPQTATVLPIADSQSIATEASSVQETQPEELGMMEPSAATAAELSEA